MAGTGAKDKVQIVRDRFAKKQVEVRTLVRDVKASLDLIGEHLREEKRMLQSDIKVHKAKLSDVLGYGDEVRGFDAFIADDSIDQLEIYKQFLGEKEFKSAKDNYEKTL